MLGDLIALPLRIGECAVRLGLRLTEDAVSFVLRGPERRVNAEVPHGRTSAANGPSAADGLDLEVVFINAEPTSTTPMSAAGPKAAAASAPAAPAPPTASPAPPPASPAPPPDSPAPATAADANSAEPDHGWVSPEASPTHVSEELELVEAFAEPGAEEGAGAAVHVEEPWHGYGQMTADEIIARLGNASREELAAITLYEGAHRSRRTIMAAARRQLQRASGASSGRA